MRETEIAIKAADIKTKRQTPAIRYYFCRELTKIAFYPSLESLQIGNVTVAPSSRARNLGVIFDKCFNFEDHIKSICKSSHDHIRNIAKIRKYIDEERDVTNTGNGERGTGNRERGTGNRSLGTNVQRQPA